MMKLRLATPEHLIDINDLRDLDYIREEGGEIRIGALTRHRDVLDSQLLFDRFPILRDAEQGVADPVVRNWGSVGGSGGERTVSMDDFHRGPYETAVADAEIFLEVRVPVREHSGSAYEKVERRAGDWSMVDAGAG